MARAAPAAQAGSEAEALPEADRLERLPASARDARARRPRGGRARRWPQAFAGGRLHHAWLLAGRAGIGKATLAYRMARHVLARPEERDPAAQSLAVPAGSAAARQIAQLAHPGLLVLRRPYDLQVEAPARRSSPWTRCAGCARSWGSRWARRAGAW